MARHCLFIFVPLFCFCCEAKAQSILQGKIYERNTQRPVPGVKVTNTNTSEVFISDTAGHYQVKAKLGDKVIFEGFAYKTDTVFVSRLQQTTVSLTPKINELAEVQIGAQGPDLSGWVWRSGRRSPREKEIKPTGKIPTGHIGNFFRKRKRDLRNQKKWEIQNEIDRRFSPFNIGYFIPLKGQELQDFIGLYKPTLAQYISTRFDFILYVNDAYKEFMKLPPDKRKLPPLIE